MEYQKKVLVCEDSMEGIFSAVYDGWLLGKRGYDVAIVTEEPQNLEFFVSYQYIETNQEKSGKVLDTIRSKLGFHAYEMVCYAAVSRHEEKGTVVYKVLQRAICGKIFDTSVFEALADPYVNLLSKLRIKVWHEIHRFYGFVRFYEMGNGILVSAIRPENDILVMLSDHFTNRYPNENWMIYDEGRRKALLHPAGQKCFVHWNITMPQKWGTELETDSEYENLWKVFCKSVAINERKNSKLQQQFLPLKFRENMPEFQE